MTGSIRFVLAALAFAACTAAYSEEDELAKALTEARLPKGWKYAGDVKTYDQTNLFELIDGEAEVYFPYGFKRTIALSYKSSEESQSRVTVEVYEMGSVLDAFGVYSNFRDTTSRLASLGTEGFAGDTQANFYKDRFFVKVHASSTSAKNKAALMPCTQAVSRVLPKNALGPEELELIDIKSIVPQTQQYFAQSVLGYDFFSTGLTAEASLTNAKVKVFVIIEVTSKTARQALERYEAFLRSSNARPDWQELPFGKIMVVEDPLYRGVIVKQIGNMIIGVAKLPKPEQGFPLLEQLQSFAAKKANQNALRERSLAAPPPAQEKK